MATAAERYKIWMEDENLHNIHGVSYPGTADKHGKIRAFPILSDDTLIVCYPKSGKPSLSLDLITAAPSPRILTSHLPFELCPKGVQEGKCKIILVIRNPKDVVVSLYQFHKKVILPGKSAIVTWEEFLQIFCEPDILPYGSWFEHVKGWLKHKSRPNLLVVFYEDLKKDLTNGVSRVAEFLGRPVTGDRAAEIAQKCQFDQMRKDGESENTPGTLNVTAFMRKGVVGDWKSHLTVTQNEQFDEVYRREMNGVQLKLEFES